MNHETTMPRAQAKGMPLRAGSMHAWPNGGTKAIPCRKAP